MTYQEALAVIHAIPWKNREPGLHRITGLLRLMGDPQDKLRFVHIAGSNGKGSCAALTASILQRAGYKTGLCISPYIHRFNERMQINGEPVSDDELAAITGYVKGFADSMEEQPTEFEFVTAVEFEYFYRHRCDIVVLEVGLGGRLDATNVIKTPEVAVITAIGLEHTAILGDTIEKIAAEKAGIVKDGGRVVISAQTQPVIDVVEKVCRQRGAALTVAQSSLRNIGFTKRGQLVSDGEHSFELPLLGSHQLQNLSTVLAAVDMLRRAEYDISPQALKEGVASTRWPGRFEILHDAPPFVVDGGHNLQCAEAVAESLTEIYPKKRVVLLLGVLADKDVKGIIAPVAKLARAAVTITPPSPRAMDAGELSKLLEDEFGIASQSAPDIKSGIETAMQLAASDEVICAYGSLYSVGQIREYFGRTK